jgi:hypothetical protein
MRRRDDCADFNMCVADSSKFIEHIINSFKYQVKVIKRLKTKDGLVQFQESLCMKAQSTEVSNQR